jgi:murein DD-endopeptidase MepM/ murein hydrolase activator NlpD
LTVCAFALAVGTTSLSGDSPAEQLGRLLLGGNYSAVTLGYDQYYSAGPNGQPAPNDKGGWHPGIDYRAQSPLPVYSPVNGTVESMDPERTKVGRLAIRISGTNDYLILLHLSAVKVAVGKPVNIGDLIAITGSTGAPAHLHAELRTGQNLGAYYFRNASDTGANRDPGTLASGGGRPTTPAPVPPPAPRPPTQPQPQPLPIAGYREAALLKIAAAPTVYVMENGRRRLIPDETTFRAHGWKFEDVTVISPAELAKIPIGADIPRVGRR